MPLPPLPEPPRYQIARPSIVETLKDRWNSDVEGAVRWVQGVRWGSVRDGLEERMKGMGGKAREGVEGLKEETQK
jgi:altered-inheritance-of-mitochondria protein 5